jgi:cysteinyl-tRNA synthetase
MSLRLHNTLSGKKEKFEPIQPGRVSMYHCGPTVYGPQHIGNLSMFVFTDVLRRMFEYFGYEARQVINFTDIGHLSGDNEGDADHGEDRMSKGLRREGMELNLDNMKLLGKKYADIFLGDLTKLNTNIQGTQFPFASDFVQEQIEMVRILEEKGFTYAGKEGVYFDTAKFPEYGKLGNINIEGLKEGARVASHDKHSPTDFLLWKFDSKMGWQSLWGQGYPGWHIECSAMIFKILGEQIDIHTGGIEHIAVHHNNEIAQSESASGKKPFAKYWLHREHLRFNDEKFSKSTGHVLYLNDLTAKGIHPLSFRYLLLTGNYKTPMNFTWEAVEGAQIALEKIVSDYAVLPENLDHTSLPLEGHLLGRFEEAISDNLNTPVAISLLQEAKSRQDIDQMDKVLGLDIKNLSEKILEIPDEILEIQKKREEARANKDFTLSDSLRVDIESRGYRVNDSANNTFILRALSSLV